MEFLIIGGIGLGVLVLSLLLGDVFDLHGVLDSDVFSVAAVAAFLGAFGFGTAAMREVVSSTLVAVVVGLALGAAFFALTLWLTRRLRGLGSDATPNSRDLVGREARVLTAIPQEGHGQVTLRVAGHPVTYSARAERALPHGTRVWVSRVLSATALEVTPIDPVEALTGTTHTMPPSDADPVDPVKENL